MQQVWKGWKCMKEVKAQNFLSRPLTLKRLAKANGRSISPVDISLINPLGKHAD